MTETKRVAHTVEDFYSKYNLRVVSNFPGVVSKEFMPFSKKGDTIVLVSYWNEVKFPEMYFDIFRKLVDFKFLMIGNWISKTYRDAYIKKLEEYGLSSRVTLISNLSESEKNNMIASSKFYMRFGNGEYGPGYGSIEALGLGVPLIINRDLGIADEIDGYNVGLVVDDSKDADKVLDFIKHYNCEEPYDKLQDEIRRFNSDHSWQKHCEVLLKILK